MTWPTLDGLPRKVYPRVMSNSELENGPVEIVDFPIDSMVDFSIVTLNYQRVGPMGLQNDTSTTEKSPGGS